MAKAKNSKVKISAFVKNKATHAKLERQAKAAGVSMVEYVSNAINQSLESDTGKRKAS